MMKDARKIKNRREFLKDGARAVVFGGFALTAVSLGSKKRTQSEQKTSCLIDLPCRICSKLPGCGEQKAAAFKQTAQQSDMPKGVKSGKR